MLSRASNSTNIFWGMRLCNRAFHHNPLTALPVSKRLLHPMKRVERAATRIHHLACSLSTAGAAADTQKPKEVAPGYRLPPTEIASIVDSPPEPILSFSPDRKLVLQLSRPPPNPPVSELARPELKLAGL